MGFDIRLPLGLLFCLNGTILALHGMLAGASTAPGSRGLYINLWWGLFMLCFGLLTLVRWRRKAGNSNAHAG